MRILLAPMEGLLDHHLRDMLTRVGGIDRCISEFIRVTDTLLPRAGVPARHARAGQRRQHTGRRAVRGQLLGSDPACTADNAGRLALGPTAWT